ncbi:MAG: ATP-binding protein [Ghiorsea sp.]
MFWLLFSDGGIERTGIFWVPFFPFLVFVVSGLQRGIRWLSIFTIGLLSIAVLNYADIYKLPYSPEETVFFFVAFLFYTLMALLFEGLRVRQQNELENKNEHLQSVRETLSDTLSTLEKEVEKRTSELQESNLKLAREVESHKATNLQLINTEQKFYQAQKMEALGTLVGGIAHDFNSLLSGINANIFLIQRHIKDKPQVQTPLDDIERMIFHASNMTKQLLTYARRDEVVKENYNLSLFMKEGVKLLQSTLPSRIKLDTTITDTPLPILGSSTQLQQVLMNLVNNARDALSNNDTPSVRLVVSTLSEAKSQRVKHPVSGDWAFLSVSDNGDGIGAQYLDQIFEPFFTTKETGEGTGLGLAMCYGAVQSHQGIIEVESQVGKGTTFYVYLPLSKKQSNPNEEIQRNIDDALQGKGELILLVDDDAALCQAQKNVLDNLGYKVELAKNGFEAIKRYAEVNVDVVIMDIMMPEMGGIKAAQHIVAMDDKAKIIFSSGYKKDSSTERFLSMHFETVESIRRLEKPFTIQQLCTAIQRELVVK